ncbi:hypothetical protein EN866_33965 [Mesorhizobium sp. M2D.F.Ca.ET.223.01.1.1]|uniref:hypothetical protein n=1 Tax=Mesorhizobium sp. M2D.F.Ca.ET.223.01.1.1 TaxID=2563940 RepID=UPI001092CC9A|nr:hypothetical protein [Mesorhizobium sp. M2D.F.Ca.ET.223.01.1.1]TGR83589.1 hypothetical protein EN866_33965 [Mesorhizobium sp. M2D.F.Ca.ET.223.01.1.1]TGT75178.1 hypothetical protein EN802_09235 [bacterium M00.F.Ca.ET.159.01.1.1]TGT88045.1 hypothetical protein EN800_06125 [bacterium M00.F.Ca.ET.157.01.1.1]
MMNPITWLGFVISACVFAVIFLGGVIVYGGEFSRDAALAAAFLGCISQFIGQDQRAYRPSIYTAYAGFVLSGLALLLFMAGR